MHSITHSLLAALSTANANARAYILTHEGSALDERQEEVNRELKAAGTLNSELGVLFASSFLDTKHNTQHTAHITQNTKQRRNSSPSIDRHAQMVL